MPTLIDLTGRIIGRLFVVERAENLVYPSGQRATQYRVRCRCGTEKIVGAARLMNGQTQSCGCRKSEVTSSRNVARRKNIADLSYPGAHVRVAVERGPASEHLCIDCDEPAADWSYNGHADIEIIDARGRRYSGDSQDYDPRCKSCHNRVDGIAANLTKALL